MSHIVVLGARILRDGDGLLTGALGRRVHAAARAHHARGWPVVAAGGVDWNGEQESTAMAHLLGALGVSSIVCEPWSRDTEENALRCRALIGAVPIVLVTCHWHMKRAQGHFERAEFSVSPLPVFGPFLPRGQRWLRTAKEEALSWLAR